MGFEEMQEIWNSQQDEQLFSVDEQALHEVIRRKSRSAERWLALLEWIMIVVNLFAGLFLVGDALQEGGPAFQLGAATLYVAYALYAVGSRLARRQEEGRFEETMVGELDKAIWRTEYLIRWGHRLSLWCMLPLALVGAISLLSGGTTWWKAALLLLLVPVTYWGTRWEMNKWHLPRKRRLEALREQLLAPEG